MLRPIHRHLRPDRAVEAGATAPVNYESRPIPVNRPEADPGAIDEQAMIVCALQETCARLYEVRVTHPDAAPLSPQRLTSPEQTAREVLAWLEITSH